MTKRQRQQIIRRILKDRSVASQKDLVDALAAAGCHVTQATISRDLRELGLQKSRDVTGSTRYLFVPSTEERRNPEPALGRMLKDYGRGVQLAQNLLVVKCDPGTAPGLGRLVDELEHERILGCVAGDDTVLVVTRDLTDGETVYGYFKELGG
jgi:transcriptional regulator of arginine metabolism